MILKPEHIASTALLKGCHKLIVACVFLCIAILLPAPAARGLENANAGLFDGDAARINMNDVYLYLHSSHHEMIPELPARVRQLTA